MNALSAVSPGDTIAGKILYYSLITHTENSSRQRQTDRLKPPSTGLHQCQDSITNSELRKHHFPDGKVCSLVFFSNTNRAKP